MLLLSYGTPMKMLLSFPNGVLLYGSSLDRELAVICYNETCVMLLGDGLTAICVLVHTFKMLLL